MLAIRMRRLGSKKRPFFRVVVIDSHAPRDGRSVEVLGYYNPTSQPEKLEIDRERFEHWVGKGAQPSDTVRTLLGRNSVERSSGIEAGPPDAVKTKPAAKSDEPLAADIDGGSSGETVLDSEGTLSDPKEETGA